MRLNLTKTSLRFVQVRLNCVRSLKELDLRLDFFLQIVMYMLFSFIGFLCSIAIVVLSSLGINEDRNDVSQYCDWNYVLDPYDWNSKCHKVTTTIIMK